MKSGTLTGPIWRSAPKYKMKVAQLAKVFVEVFQIVIGSSDIESYETGYPDLATMVGGVETFGMAQRYENFLNSKEGVKEPQESNCFSG